MELIELPLDAVHAPGWNPNRMDDAMRARLRRSLERFGVVVPLLVRATGDGAYETVGGAQRLSVLKEMEVESAPCMVTTLDDANARLLAQALNDIEGKDDAVLRADLLRFVLKTLPAEEVHGLLPETRETLEQIGSLTQTDLGEHLKQWEDAQQARLKHFVSQLTASQHATVEKAIKLAQKLALKDAKQPGARNRKGANPNARGNALYAVCKSYLEHANAYTRVYTQDEEK